MAGALGRLARLVGFDGGVRARPRIQCPGSVSLEADFQAHRRIIGGAWRSHDFASKALKKVKVAARFARVAVSDAPAPRTSMLLRLVLDSEGRAELEVLGMAQLTELIAVLERAA